MKMSSEIIRDVIICIEHKLNIDSDITSLEINTIFWKNIYEDSVLCAKYNIDDIKYCIYKLCEDEFIEAEVRTGGSRIYYIDIHDITWKGYELLNNIKDNSVWDLVKSKLQFGTNISISAMSDIIKAAIVAKAKGCLNI